MKKLFLLVLSFMLILSMSVVFINVGNMDFADTPAGTISQSPVGAEINKQPEKADIPVEEEAADVVDASTGVDMGSTISVTEITQDTIWNLTAQSTTLSGTVTIKNGAKLTITANQSLANVGNGIHLNLNKPSSSTYYGAFFKVEENSSLVITGYDSPDNDHSTGNILFQSSEKRSNSPAIVATSANEISLTNITFANHQSTKGGAVYLDGECQQVNINKCKIWWHGYTNYTSGADTSAIWMTENYSCPETNISNCVFAKCFSTYGGAIRYQGVAENSIVNIENIYLVEAGSVSSYGGFLSIEGKNATFNLSGNTVSNCTSATLGGAIYVADYSSTTLNINANNSITYCSATDKGGAIYFGAGVLNVNDGTLSNNVSSKYGGAIYVGNGTVNVTGGTFNVNTVNSTGGGGAIYTSGGIVNISAGSFSGRTTRYTGNGGLIYCNGGKINISGGNFKNNYIEYGYGGAIYLNAGEIVFAENSTSVIENCTAENGGGIYSTGGTLEINGGTIQNCQAYYHSDTTGYGAGVYVSNTESFKMNGGTIQDCIATFGGGISVYNGSNNTVVNANITGGNVYHNKGTRYGGGIYIHKNSNVIVGGNVIIDDNYTDKELDSTDASYRRGGGIYVGDGGSLKLCGNATISNNDAFMGGGVYFCKSKSALIDGTEEEAPIIQNNHAGDSGGGIVVDGCTLTVNYANILDNVAEVEAVVYSSGSEDVQTDEKNFGGGGILLWLEENVSYLEFYNGIMSGNMAWDGSGGAICSSRKWNTDKNKGYITIWDGKFTSNQAGNGGAIYADYLSELTMYGGTIGGAAKDDNDYKTIASNNPSAYPPIKVPMDANYALGCADTDGDGVTDEGDGDFGGGGGLYIRGTAVLQDVEIVGNLAAKGAGIDLGTSEYTYDKKIYSGTVTSINSSYIYNRATDNGGGVYLTDCDLTKTVATFPTFTSNNDDICHNRAVNGGGIYCGSRTNVNLYGAYVNENILRYYDPNSDGQIVYGGGIYSRGAKLKTAKSVDEAYDNGIDDGEDNYISGRTCQIADNKACDSEDNEANTKYKKATINGGAIFSDALATNDLSYTYIGGNEACNLGGGLYVASTKGLSYSNSKVSANAYTKIDHCTVSDNTLTAVYDDSKGIKSNGAGIFSTITSNSQANYYTYPNYINNNAQFTLTNSTISNNKCSGFGGGLYVDYYYQDTNTDLLHNNKIYNNTAGYGAGINFGDCAGIGKDVTMTATDIYGNVATGEGGGIRSNGHIIFKRATVTNEDTGKKEILGNIFNNNANLGGGLYANKGTFITTALITNNTAVIGGGVYSYASTCTVNLLEDGTAPIYGNLADPVEGNSLKSQGDDVYSKSGATLIIPAKANYDTKSDKFGIWYSDYSTDRFRTGPDLINNALIKNVTTTSGNYKSNGEVAATFHLPTANVSLGILQALDPWENEYDPQVNGDSKYQYEFVICKGDKILSKEDFTGDYEYIACSITANNKTEYMHFKNSETGSIFVSPGEKFSIGGLVAGLQVRMYTPTDSKIMSSFVKSVVASYDWGDEVVDIKTEDVKSGLTVVKSISTDAIPALDTVKSYTASVTNHIFGTKVTINYYDRKVEKGEPADISKTPTKVTKSYLGPDYVDYFNNSDSTGERQLNNFSYMITGAGVAANNHARGIDNIIDQYYLWHSQAGAVDGVKNTIYPGSETTYAKYDGDGDGVADFTDFANHTDASGNFVTTDNSKWVTYTTASNTEIEPDIYNTVWDDFSKYEDIHSVNQIDVWLFNTPKIYTAKVYSAQRDGHLENYLGNGIYASSNEPRRFNAYYNQRFNGELGDASDEASEHLKKYNDNINGYIDEYISTSYRIRGVDGKTVYFQYWSYDPEGKVVASTDISYAHRVTADVELYAIYGQGEFWDTGLTLLENTTDFYHIDTNGDGYGDAEYIRFNTINTPYNTTNVDYVASVFLMIDGENINVNQTRLRDDLNAYFETNNDISKGSHTLNDLTVYDTSGKAVNASIVLDVYEIVDEIKEDFDITKTSLDRVQFFKEYKLSDVIDKTILTLGTMRDNGNWYVSTNCVSYLLSDIDLDVEGDLDIGDGEIDWE